MQAVKQTKIDFAAKEKICGSTVFPEFFKPGEVEITRRMNRHPDCQFSNPDYIPDERLFRRCLAYNMVGNMKPFGIYGETGTGKTELVLYIADKLNIPLYVIKTHAALMPEDIEGAKDLATTENGVVTKNSLGLAAKAYVNGGILLLDEVDKCNPAFSAAIHGLVEGKPWPIEQFSCVLNAHPDFKVFATANTLGEGGHERYITSNRLDAALRRRFGWFQCHFPAQDHELKILDKKFPKLPHRMKVDMVTLANAFRDALLGPDRDGNIDNPINCVFSTSTLVDWGKSLFCFGKKAVFRESLDYAFQGSVDPEYKDQVEDIIQTVFGNVKDLTVEDALKEYSPEKK